MKNYSTTNQKENTVRRLIKEIGENETVKSLKKMWNKRKITNEEMIKLLTQIKQGE